MGENRISMNKYKVLAGHGDGGAASIAEIHADIVDITNSGDLVFMRRRQTPGEAAEVFLCAFSARNWHTVEIIT